MKTLKCLAVAATLCLLLLFAPKATVRISHEDISFGAASERSPKWPKVRAEHLRLHGECLACGGTEDLNVHHIVSFSVNPSLELSPGNLCTLCTKNKFGMNCHFIFGHNGNWKCRNQNVLRDASNFREMLSSRLCDEPKVN